MLLNTQLALSVLLVVTVTNTFAADQCGGTFSNGAGKIKFDAKTTSNSTCIWLITNSTGSQVSLVFKSLTLGSSNLTITAGNESGSPQIVQYSKYTGAPVVISHAKTTKIVYSKGADGMTITFDVDLNQTKPGAPVVISHAKTTKIVYSKGANDTTTVFELDYNTANCSVKASGSKGVVNSPTYLNNSGDVSCSYEVSLGSNVDVPVVSLTSLVPLVGVSLKVGFDEKNATDLGTTSDVFGPAGAKAIKMDLKINNGTVQKFNAVYQTADKACSGMFKTNSTGAMKKLALPSTNALPIQCYAQIVSSDDKKQVFVLPSGKGASVAGGDSVLFLDGPSQSASVIGSLGGGAPFFVSSGNKMTVIASLGTKTSRDTSLQYKQDGFSKLYTLSDTAKKVNISLEGSQVNGGDVYIQVSSSQMVKVEIDATTKLTNSTVLVHDIKANLLFTFSKDTSFFPVNVPVGGSLIIVKGLTGTDKLQMAVSQSAKTDCNQLYQGASGMINIALDNKTTSGCTTVVSTGSKDTVTILELDSVSLCLTSKVEIFEGTGPTAAKLGTIDNTVAGSSLPQIQFPAGSQPKLVWSTVDTSCGKQSLTARYWSTQSVCGSLGTNLKGNVKTPNFPNQYPLNLACDWAVPAQNNSMLYVSANTLQFGKAHSIVLKQNGTAKATFSGKIAHHHMPNDMIIANNKLTMDFTSKTNDSSKLDVPGQGADITYKVLTCGGMVTNVNTTISSPNKTTPIECIWIIQVPAKGDKKSVNIVSANTCGGMVTNANTTISSPNKTTPVECIWIIQVPAKGDKKSVNIVSANISVTGYDKTSQATTLEVRDGGSVRNNSLALDLQNGTKVLSRYNFLWVRYVFTPATDAAKPFNFALKFSIYNCNSSSLCDNKLCLHPDWRCNGIDDCGDDTDERNCNGTRPIPTTPAPSPQPQPHPQDSGSKGVAAYWVVICLLIGIGIGVAIVFIIPKIMRRARLRNYSSFSNTENA